MTKKQNIGPVALLNGESDSLESLRETLDSICNPLLQTAEAMLRDRGKEIDQSRRREWAEKARQRAARLRIRNPRLPELPPASGEVWHAIDALKTWVEEATIIEKSGVCRHSADFTSVVWFGTPHVFNKTQAECIKQLWGEWEKGTPTLSEKYIGELVDPNIDRFRLALVFRDHAAWGSMVLAVEGKKGIFRLNKPESQEAHS